MESGKIIVVANQKGGVAKTSTVRNLSYALAEMGKKVLVVDFDPQYNLTTSFGVLPTQAPYNTGTLITNLLLDESLPDTNEFIQKIGSVDLIPSSRSLTVAEANLLMTPDSNDYLAALLNPLRLSYGNFTPISDMTNKLTVAAGRGMRYALFVQGFDQLKEKYSDNIANTIKGNCQVWAYLQSDDPETLREMSDKLGSYTTSSYQLSASNGKYTTPSNSQSVSLTERKLLNTDEVRRVKRPHQIITSRDHPAMMYAPDLSQWMFNKMLGLGDMEHNRRLREEREQKRPIITDTKQEIALWNIWIYYQKDIMRRLAQQKGAMGGGLDDD